MVFLIGKSNKSDASRSSFELVELTLFKVISVVIIVISLPNVKYFPIFHKIIEYPSQK